MKVTVIDMKMTGYGMVCIKIKTVKNLFFAQLITKYKHVWAIENPHGSLLTSFLFQCLRMDCRWAVHITKSSVISPHDLSIPLKNVHLKVLYRTRSISSSAFIFP